MTDTPQVADEVSVKDARARTADAWQDIEFGVLCHTLKAATSLEDVIRSVFHVTVESVKAYRMLAKVVHPDRAPEDKKAMATEAFVRLQELWGTYLSPLVAATVTGPKGTYTNVVWVGQDDLANYFTGYSDMGNRMLLKRSKTAGRSSDFFDRERDALELLAANLKPSGSAFFPQLETFFMMEENKLRYMTHVFHHSYDLVSVATVLEAYPEGLDARHVAWMWRRVLKALGLARSAPLLVHGALTPDNILLEVDQHGVVLNNWCFSPVPGAPVTSIVGKYRSWYSDQTMQKKSATPTADLHMATKSMLALLDNKAPIQLHRFASGCLSERAKGIHPYQLLAELDELLEKLYGTRKFMPFPDHESLPIWPATITGKR